MDHGRWVACASSSTAFHLAVSSVASGSVDVALAVGVEKLSHPDKTKSFAAIGAAVDLLQLDELKAWSGAGAAGGGDDSKRSFFMDIYAANTRAYMERTGATPVDFAEVAVKSHRHGALNPNAQYRTPVTAEEVLASRMVSDPLTLLMCSPVGDGAAVMVICSPRRIRNLPGPTVRVRASTLISGTDQSDAEPAAARASAPAYEQAGLGPQDLDVVEVHDAAAPAELMVYEELGLCGPGEGSALLRSGATALGGRVPVTPPAACSPGGTRWVPPGAPNWSNSPISCVGAAGRGRAGLTWRPLRGAPSLTIHLVLPREQSPLHRRIRAVAKTLAHELHWLPD
jgi:acetyl-CoA acyltransferase